ncbi:MAG: sulfotransferase [Spirochaetota bacterium]
MKCGWNIPDIAKKIPEIKFIHIYRDGRAVLNSLMRTKKVYATGQMAEEPLTPSLRWRGWMKYINNLDAALNERVCHVQYEKLLKNPDEQLARIFTFLGVKHIFLDEHALNKYAKRIPTVESSLHPNVGKGPILERHFSWQSELPEENIRIFEMVNGRILQKFGYPLLYHQNWKGLLSLSVMKNMFIALGKIGQRRMKKILQNKVVVKQKL